MFIPPPTLTLPAHRQLDNCGCSTHVAFRQGYWSPHSYLSSEINNNLIERLRRGYDDNCPWEVMLDSARRAFDLWADGGALNTTRLAESDSLPAVDGAPLDDLAKYVLASGYMPNSTHCPLLARKFPGELKGILLKTMMGCAGGGFASHCLHPRKANQSR